jgi:hypothetical protein
VAARAVKMGYRWKAYNGEKIRFWEDVFGWALAVYHFSAGRFIA